MIDTQRLKYLRTARVLAGAACIALYPLMIVGIYATLGVFLIIAARNPLAHLSLIWFAVWSSTVHGGIMAVQALAFAQHRAIFLEMCRHSSLRRSLWGFSLPRGEEAKKKARNLQGPA